VEFWTAYPRKDAKADARTAWNKLNPADGLRQTILNNIRARKTTADWQKDGGQFVPYAATYLNRRRWEDELAGQSAEEWAGAV
jgi:hypothetical protein